MERAVAVAGALALLERQAADIASPPSLFSALRQDTVSVIAEVKRSSPSKGAISPGLDAVSQARKYVNGGAAAISVLTEPTRFGGSLEDLRQVSAAVGAPVLRKDFIVHPVQVWEARVNGASAILLIVRALAPDQLRELSETARRAQLEVLFEVRDEIELQRALAFGATVVGVNNRNLETLVIDPRTAPQLIPLIPPDVVAIAESGMHTSQDAEAAVAAGADALLVGSALSAAMDAAAATAAFTAFRRINRG